MEGATYRYENSRYSDIFLENLEQEKEYLLDYYYQSTSSMQRLGYFISIMEISIFTVNCV